MLTWLIPRSAQINQSYFYGGPKGSNSLQRKKTLANIKMLLSTQNTKRSNETSQNTIEEFLGNRNVTEQLRK